MQTPADYPALTIPLLDSIRFLGAQGWCPATGGNFSVRIDEHLRLITRSGRDKRQIDSADLMICNANGQAVDPNCRPSDETALHMMLYRLDPQIQAVFHTHSIPATLLSRNHPGQSLQIQGFEMQKSVQGQTSHEGPMTLALMDNTQDIPALASALQELWLQGQISSPGLLVRGHGLYAWGRSIAEAQRHTEGFEFLLHCLWQEHRLGARA